jgi:leader peptidase (prepilin peptidase) / N-methyltransferase
MAESLILLALLGGSLGSFLATAIERITRGVPIVHGRSACESCGRRLSWHELIPVVSYIALHGRCSGCRSRIPPVCIVIELVTAAVLPVLFMIYGYTTEFLETALAFFVLLPVVVTDFRELRIPNAFVLAGIILRLGEAALVDSGTLFRTVAAGAFGGILVASILLAGKSLAGREVMGWGDVKLSFLIASFTGSGLFLVTLWTASVIGLLWVSLRRPADDKIPFGACLALAGWMILHLADSLISLWIACRTYLT